MSDNTQEYLVQVHTTTTQNTIVTPLEEVVTPLDNTSSKNVSGEGRKVVSEKKKIVGVFYKGNEYAKLNPDFVGCVEGALGIREWLESQGHQYIVTDDKEGPDSELERNLPDAHVVISTPFHPAYVTAERIKKAKNLELLLTAGIGSDHIDLKAASAAGITVAEVTGSNVVSVAEDELMRILILIKNFLARVPSVCLMGNGMLLALLTELMILKARPVGTVGAGRIWKLFTPKVETFSTVIFCILIELGWILDWRKRLEQILRRTLMPCFQSVMLLLSTRLLLSRQGGLFDKDKISKCKKGVLIVNNARGAIMDTQAVADACSNGHVAGYSGDVWFPQPAPKDHPWRYMPNHAMTPHVSGTTIDAQLRYGGGVKGMLDRHFRGEGFPEQKYMVKEGQLASQYR
uniref:Formate dehydrogenase n=1 Tax=Phaseolus vulgaris TaxID=3885 RepID=T2DN09_PHAVU|nr:formate dehydrogenase [Phaseolus vulgaris]